MNEDDSKVDKKVAVINGNGRDDNNDIYEDGFFAKILQAISMIKQTQSRAPSYLSAALGKVLDVLHSIIPVSPPPEGYDERTEQANNKRFNANTNDCRGVITIQRNSELRSELLGGIIPSPVLPQVKETPIEGTPPPVVLAATIEERSVPGPVSTLDPARRVTITLLEPDKKDDTAENASTNSLKSWTPADENPPSKSFKEARSSGNSGEQDFGEFRSSLDPKGTYGLQVDDPFPFGGTIEELTMPSPISILDPAGRLNSLHYDPTADNSARESVSMNELLTKSMDGMARKSLVLTSIKENLVEQATAKKSVELVGNQNHGQQGSSSGQPAINRTSMPPAVASFVRPSLSIIPAIPTTNLYGWNFDIFGLEVASGYRPLVCLGMQILTDFGVHTSLNTNLDVLKNWLILMEANYHQYNPYHNSTHAADVLQACAYFLKTERLKNFLDPINQAICLIACVIHDLDHPGRTNTYLAQTRHNLAMLYNDKVILESHHVAFAFRLTCADARVNIFQNLDQEMYQKVRSSIVDMVLSTEMVNHYTYLTSFIAAINETYSLTGYGHTGSYSYTPTAPDPFKTNDNIILTRRMLIKCSDVSNPARPIRLSVEWALRICEEFFDETNEAMKLNMPLTLPSFVRETCSIPEVQNTFNDFFTLQLFTLWDEFAGVPAVLTQLRQNVNFWRQLMEDNINTVSEVREYFNKNMPGTNPVL